MREILVEIPNYEMGAKENRKYIMLSARELQLMKHSVQLYANKLESIEKEEGDFQIAKNSELKTANRLIKFLESNDVVSPSINGRRKSNTGVDPMEAMLLDEDGNINIDKNKLEVIRKEQSEKMKEVEK